MCIDMKDFNELVKTINKMELTLNDVKKDGENTLGQLTKLNHRVAKAEDKIEDTQENIHTLKRYRAGRIADCPTMPEVLKVIEKVIALEKESVANKAVRREVRWLFLSLIIPLAGVIVALLNLIY